MYKEKGIKGYWVTHGLGLDSMNTHLIFRICLNDALNLGKISLPLFNFETVSKNML